ncbi:MAG: hypothetical protein KJT03_22455, partial [Verrucomicrobiae bacterium]|nr:hypothetical protein [Verrucomicrobiae bacterium]
ANDFAWAKEGFETISRELRFRLECDEASHQIDLSLPEGLQRMLKRLPGEIHPRFNDNASMWSLTADRQAMAEEINLCRAEENRWPRKHLLWEQHPALIWMQDRLLNSFGLHQASCVNLQHLEPDERIVVGSAVIPNRKGHPLIERWYGMQFIDGKFTKDFSIEELIKRTRFHEDFPNPANLAIDSEAVQKLFRDAVDMMRVLMSEERDRFRKETEPELKKQLDKLRAFLEGRTQQLEMELSTHNGTVTTAQQTIRRQRKERMLRQIHKVHDEYKKWIVDTMETEDAPSIRLFAVFGNFGED